MAARYSKSRAFGASTEVLRDAIEWAMRDIGARHLRWTHGDVRVEARVPLSFWSFGEIVKATISEAGSVQVESRCAWPLQVIDWGKNKRNCNDLLESIKVRIDRIA